MTGHCLVVLVLVAAMLTCAGGALIKVGGKSGWTQHVNYSDWAAHRHFYVGDWLYFVFDKRYYTVLEVNETNYEQCRDSEFVKNVTRGGRDVFNLTESRDYYFLSSGGYCFHGMKVAIRVDPRRRIAPPSQSPSSLNISGGPTPRSNSRFLVILSTSILILVLFKML